MLEIQTLTAFTGGYLGQRKIFLFYILGVFSIGLWWRASLPSHFGKSNKAKLNQPVIKLNYVSFNIGIQFLHTIKCWSFSPLRTFIERTTTIGFSVLYQIIEILHIGICDAMMSFEFKQIEQYRDKCPWLNLSIGWINIRNISIMKTELSKVGILIYKCSRGIVLSDDGQVVAEKL